MNNKPYSHILICLSAVQLFFLYPPFARSEITDRASRNHYEDGTIQQESIYKNSQLHGSDRTFHPDGELKAEVHYKEGTRHGPYKRFNQDGELIEKDEYVNGKHEGAVCVHDPKAGINQEQNYKSNKWNNKRMVCQPTEEKLIAEDYLNGKLHGKMMICDPSGKISFASNYVNGVKEGEAPEAEGPEAEVPEVEAVSGGPAVQADKMATAEDNEPKKPVPDVAAKPAWERVYFPEYKGYIVSYERRSDWQNYGTSTPSKKLHTYADGVRQYLPFHSFTSFVKDMKTLNNEIDFTPSGNYAGLVKFSVKQYHPPRPVNLDNWATKEKEDWVNFAMKVYEDGFKDILGKKSFYYLTSGLTTWKDGAEVPTEHPTQKNIVIPLNDDVVLVISYGVDYFHEHMDALEPVFERMLNSIQVTPAEALQDKSISKLHVTPEVVISDEGHGYSAGFYFTLPVGWCVELLDVKQASSTAKGGRLAVEVFREDDEAASLLLVAEALEPGKGFLEMGDLLINKLVKDIAVESGQKTPSLNKFLCTGHVYNLIFGGGGKITHYKEWEGKDNEGRPVKARIYSGGNRQAACHVVYLNDPDDYEELLPAINDIFNSLNASEDWVR